jgi:DNA invertase Pin-like site-specific DNA recombinase
MTGTLSGSSRPFRVALYARTSTSRDQHPAMQLHALRELSSQRGWHVVGEFVDHGYSGAKDRRPQLDAMMQLVHRGGANAVAVYKFDRFARSIRHLILALDDFQSRGVEFISLSDGIDTSTPTGRFAFTLIGAVAELEKSILRSRTLSGLDAARARGARLGRPPIVFDVRRAADLRAEGKTFRQIARLLGVGATTIHRALAAQAAAVPESVSSAAVYASRQTAEIPSVAVVA